MKRKRFFLVVVLVMLTAFVLLSSAAFACTLSFSISYDNTGKVVMKNFDSDISKHIPDGVYQATGPETKDIHYYVCPRQFAVVGGYKVGSLEGGVYKIVGPGTYTESINNGFVIVVDKSTIAKEWQFRLYQVHKNSWAIKYFFDSALPK